jgi:hypothetical protein
MKTIILSSKLLNNFIIFETNKTEIELIEHLKGIDFTDEQALFKELILSSDLESEIHSKNTFETNKESERFSAVIKKEKDGFNYIGANRGKEVINAKTSPDNVSGISGMSNLFLALCQLMFWLVIIASVFIALKISVISGVSLAVGSLIGFGLIFVLGDLLKNTVEINQKLNK